MSKIFIKIFRIFFIFVSSIMVIGVTLATVKNYMIQEVEYTQIKNNFFVKDKYYFNGKVLPKNKNVVEIKAARDMVINDVNIKAGQILDKDYNEMFKLSTDNYSDVSTEILDDYNTKVKGINEEINTILKDISKKIGREISSINEINPNDTISVFAPATGKITGLSIEKDKILDSDFISNIIDDSALIIPFSMSSYEYPSMYAGQDVLLSYAGYEGYYKGKVASINPNAVPGKDKISYIYNGVIETVNPGLISPGISVGIHTEKDGRPNMTLSSNSVVESYVKNVKITVPTYIKDICATEVNVIEGETVKQGQLIAKLGGEALSESLNSDIKKINDKLELISKAQKSIQGLYGDIITSNIDHSVEIGNNGACYINEKIYVDYVTDKLTLRKDDVILRYRLCNISNLSIIADVNKEVYEQLYMYNSIISYGVGRGAGGKVTKESEKKFDDHYELAFAFENDNPYNLKINDEVFFEISSERNRNNVLYKTAIVPKGELKAGENCYIYVINTEDTMFGEVEIIRQKKAIIQYVGPQVVELRFIDSIDNDKIKIVNNANTILKDGMRVKTK